MPDESYQHKHHFNQHRLKSGEKRTWWVIILTSITMIGEIITGLLFGSMALLADGLHMASHAMALTISAFAYVYSRHHAHDRRFSFGTGKVSSLAGYSSAILLVFFALYMIWESTRRILEPIDIAFNQAIYVACVGLMVNVLSVFILNVKGHEHSSDTPAHHHDHNLRAAYLHVLADALTSLLAIIALMGGKYLGFNWMDPLMGIIGALLISRWSIGLLKDTSRVLLDHQAGNDLVSTVQRNLERDGKTKVTDLHIWSIGSNNFAAAISVICEPPLDSRYYQDKLADIKEIAHCTINIESKLSES